eukprot:CAMPEP_0175063672 /NCGR_PEP_ID=MMETSP0052_2-20121109/14894_1 /TAXON_ID=51329 ORGANISM="Polytomella parva, Strain SAG 63-3" /NCGR_SAMPLE_ID=MMETSP0052_2 /ASSEMBLY_ACC=CAM_ASM_000194 /LENGTH=229 /DNA_ID=CAMNT_0016329911 /DNA_START=219 /DNA_END=904 /DNA_ORIENTATION=-
MASSPPPFPSSLSKPTQPSSRFAVTSRTSLPLRLDEEFSFSPTISSSPSYLFSNHGKASLARRTAKNDAREKKKRRRAEAMFGKPLKWDYKVQGSKFHSIDNSDMQKSTDCDNIDLLRKLSPDSDFKSSESLAPTTQDTPLFRLSETADARFPIPSALAATPRSPRSKSEFGRPIKSAALNRAAAASPPSSSSSPLSLRSPLSSPPQDSPFEQPPSPSRPLAFPLPLAP